MPEWVWVLLGVLALIPFGAGLTAWYQHRQSRAEDKRRLRENGSAAVSPLRTSLLGSAQVQSRLGRTKRTTRTYVSRTNCGGRRFAQYANAHPSAEIRELAYQVAEAVQKDLAAVLYLLATRNTSATMEPYEASKQAHANSQRLVDELLQKIRDY